ncbi:MAG: ATP-binding protein [Acidobacteria bacterium]|nr:ATP-binding protein [Acidobacteriota bacterium]
MSAWPLVVVLTGSECTGKTTLAGDLAVYFGAPSSPEYVREYLDRKGTPLDASDVSSIAHGQMRVEDEAASSASRLVIRDTDLISTVVYSRHYNGACPPWIADAAKQRLADLYLLLHPDVPWQADGLQHDRPEQRADMHELFRRQLDVSGARVVDIVGSWETRRETAIEAVTQAVARALSAASSA